MLDQESLEALFHIPHPGRAVNKGQQPAKTSG